MQITQKQSEKSITASAPGKLMLTGSYAVVHGRPTVVTAVDQRLYVTVEENGKDTFHLQAPDLGLKSYTKTIDELGTRDLPKAVRFIETLYKIFLEKHPQQNGINVTTKSDFSSSFGFGSSSAVTVAFAKALTTLYKVELTKHELFDLCYQTVLKVQGVGSGFDIAAAIWGGTIKYVTPAKVIEEIKISDLPMVVGYTGVKADTPTLIRIVNSNLERYPDKINAIFDEIGRISDNLVEALQENDLQAVGKLFNDHQQEVRSLGVSSIELEKLIHASLEAGALGATLSGAGGGDCMVAVVDEAQRKGVKQAIEQAGGEIMRVQLGAEGVRL